MSGAHGWSRRDFGRAVALLALVMGQPGAAAGRAGLPATAEPDARQRALMRAVSQLVIPRSTTPGAGELGVGDFVLLALACGHGGATAPAALASFRRPDGSLRHLDWLQAELNRRAGGDWMGKPARVRTAALAALDAQAFPAPGTAGEPSPWQTIKGLILTGYYTSQVGASKELRFEFTPGRFDNDLPLKPGDTGWSSDWNAVEFG